MRRGKVFLCLLLIFCISFSTACKGGDAPVKEPEENPTTDITEPVNTEYLDVEMSPDYSGLADVESYVTYYFDSQSGSDENDGLSENAPMQSLKAMNKLIKTITSDTPVRILVKAGSEYTGKLKLYGFEATDENPLLVSVYGKSEKNPYAKFIGQENSSAIVIGTSNVRINGLEVTGERANIGIQLDPQQAGAMKNVVIADSYFHDINFRTSELKEGLPEVGVGLTPDQCKTLCPDSNYIYQMGAIVGEANTPEFMGPSWFENLWIENNKFERVSRVGVWIYGQWTRRPGFSWGKNHYYSDEVGYYPHHNVIVRNNNFDHVGGDGVVLGAVYDGWLEKNTSTYAHYLGRAGVYCVAMWVHSCNNLRFQFNEAAYTYLRNGSGDGEGFDIDIGNRNIIFQYNYAHHNEGGGLLCGSCGSEMVLYDENGDFIPDEDGLPRIEYLLPESKDFVIRNNVFVDNDVRGANIGGYVSNYTFENNLLVMPGKSETELFVENVDFNSTNTKGSGLAWRNNIFICRGGLSAGFSMAFTSDDYSYDSNVFWGFSEESLKLVKEQLGEHLKNMIVEDPGIALDNPDFMGLEAMYNYKPSNADMLKGALPLTETNRYDAEGVDVTGIQYFGAFGTTK